MTAAPVTQPAASPAPAASPDAADDFDPADSTLLIVDDNEQNVELLQAYLEPMGCRIDTAADGLQALSRLDDTDLPVPDLILLDVMMPRMSGFEVCRKVKENPTTRAIPVMMVTALNELSDVERGVESGTDDFVSKPVNKLELVTRVKSLLRVRHLKRQLDQTQQRLRDAQSGHQE